MPDCTPDELAALAKCFKCLPGQTLQEVQTYLLCQILNNGGGGGTPVFADQPANVVFSGPAAGPAAAPAFRALVTADLGTTMTPQFLRVGIGTPADAAKALTCLIPGGVGDQTVASFDCTAGNPLITIGGTYIRYFTGADQLFFGVSSGGALGALSITSAGLLTVPSNVTVLTGIFQCQGNSGTSATYDATNTITTTGGIITSSTQPTQTANTVFAGPAAAGPSVPTFRALVAADIPSLSAVYVPVGRTITIAGTVNQVISSAGAQDLSANRTWTLSLPQSIATTSTVQFGVLRIGTASTVGALNALIAGAAGDQEIARFNCTTGDPYLTIGTNGADDGGLLQYRRSTNIWRLGIHGHANVVEIDANALLSATGGLITSTGNIEATAGIFICQANNGISQTFDTGALDTQITFVGGIAVGIA